MCARGKQTPQIKIFAGVRCPFWATRRRARVCNVSWVFVEKKVFLTICFLAVSRHLEHDNHAHVSTFFLSGTPNVDLYFIFSVPFWSFNYIYGSRGGLVWVNFRIIVKFSDRGLVQLCNDIIYLEIRQKTVKQEAAENVKKIDFEFSRKNFSFEKNYFSRYVFWTFLET